MTKQDRNKLGILMVLLAVLGLTLYLTFRTPQPVASMAAARPKEATKTSAHPPAPNEAHIRLDLLQNAEAAEDIGRRNPFQYRQSPAPALPPPTGFAPGSTPGNPSPNTAPVITTRPAPPPPIPLRYQGFAVVNSGTGQFTAFLADDTRHYNVTTGEVLMGRYRILNINDRVVEIEDLEQNRRQTLPLQN